MEYLEELGLLKMDFLALKNLTLIDNILNGLNTVLVSHRRIGKTGLICHCFDQSAIKKNYRVFFVDILATTSLREFVMLLGKEIITSLKPKSKKFTDALKNVFMSLRGGFKMDALTGEPSFELSLGEIESPETTLDEIFKYLGNADMPCVVAMRQRLRYVCLTKCPLPSIKQSNRYSFWYHCIGPK